MVPGIQLQFAFRLVMRSSHLHADQRNDTVLAHCKCCGACTSLLVEYMVQWSDLGGKCPLFGFVMVSMLRFLAVYSFGRGLFTRTLEKKAYAWSFSLDGLIIPTNEDGSPWIPYPLPDIHKMLCAVFGRLHDVR